MKSKTLLILIALIAFLSTTSFAQQERKPNVCEFRTDMRKLWEDHITWTRNVILNIIDELPGTNEAVARLLQNQADIGSAFGSIYGSEVGDSITSLLTTHITTAADLLIALKSGDSAAIADANEIWYENGEDIVAYLVSINPKYDEDELDEMMDMHLDLTAQEAVARLNADYEGDVEAYDAVHEEAMAMSDFLAEGIIDQFPGMFSHNAGRPMMIVDLSNQPFLEQNNPNPFTESTKISYYIPEEVQTAEIIFSDALGRVIKSVKIDTRGEGDIIVNATSLNPGMYTYSFIIDGKTVDEKKMVH